jgi:hypothetical protein
VSDVRTATQTANTRPSLHRRIRDWSKDSLSPKRTIDGCTFPSTAQYDMSLALAPAISSFVAFRFIRPCRQGLPEPAPRALPTGRAPGVYIYLLLPSLDSPYRTSSASTTNSMYNLSAARNKVVNEPPLDFVDCPLWDLAVCFFRAVSRYVSRLLTLIAYSLRARTLFAYTSYASALSDISSVSEEFFLPLHGHNHLLSAL